MQDFAIREKATLSALIERLRYEQARKIDVVVPASAIRSEGGALRVAGAEPIVTDHGVTAVDGTYGPTGVMLEGLADKLVIPIKYVRRLHAERPDLFDGNVNGLLHGSRIRRSVDGTTTQEFPGDDRAFLLRLYATDESGTSGVARSIHSDRYRITHYLDSAMATLEGLSAAGLSQDDVLIRAEVSERRMYLDIEAPQVQAYASEFLRDYRSPFGNRAGHELPIIHAGVRVTDSEVGQGAYSTVPYVVVEWCSNGMTRNADLIRNIHVGSRMDEGVVQWGEDTERKNRELITLQVRDAVSTFLTPEYMAQVADDLNAQATTQVRGLESAQAAIKSVGKRLAYTQEQQAGILDMFMQSGQFTSAGVTNAVTAFAQTVPDVDEAKRLESTALDALALI